MSTATLETVEDTFDLDVREISEQETPTLGANSGFPTCFTCITCHQSCHTHTGCC